MTARHNQTNKLSLWWLTGCRLSGACDAFLCKSEFTTPNLKAPQWICSGKHGRQIQQLMKWFDVTWKEDRRSRLLTQTLRDFYWAQVNWMNVKMTTSKLKMATEVKSNCCDDICVCVHGLGLCRSWLSFGIGIPTWMTVPLHFSVSEVVFFRDTSTMARNIGLCSSDILNQEQQRPANLHC